MNDMKEKIYKKFKNIDNKVKNKIIKEINSIANYQCDVCDFLWKSNKFEKICPSCNEKFISIKFKSSIKIGKYDVKGLKFYSDEEL